MLTLDTSNTTREVVICDDCKGFGKVHNPNDNGPNYHQCNACNGSGRRIKVVTTKYVSFHINIMEIKE